MASLSSELDHNATTYGVYPGILFSNRMDLPPAELWSEPCAEGRQRRPSSGTVPPTAESGIVMPLISCRMKEQPEPLVHGDYRSQTNLPAWEISDNRACQGIRAGHAAKCVSMDQDCGCSQALASHNRGCQEIRAGHAAKCFATDQACGCSQVLASHNRASQKIRAGHGAKCFATDQDCGCSQVLAAAGLRDATCFQSQGIVTESRSGRDVAPRGILPMQHLQKSCTALEKCRSSCYQRSGYPRSKKKNERCRKERRSKCDRDEVPVTCEIGQDSREDELGSQKDYALSTSASSFYLEQANSVRHAGGLCSPCKFFRSKGGCKSGLNCQFCHCSHHELSRS
eukprot:TRINITY_DN8296_c1_g2_i1.p1 TRINITY_DN8296_c1_g2~~TRINITY_DN8296_c1_g2_i1.p1  ORF type:complete len:354 (+),score=24.28 TRINITY_DN8296_c1_g2_i1:42-1064(+)